MVLSEFNVNLHLVFYYFAANFEGQSSIHVFSDMAGYKVPAKKLRLENDNPTTSENHSGSDDWGEDLAISVDQLQKLDFIASQALSQIECQKSFSPVKFGPSLKQKSHSFSGEKENNSSRISLAEFYAPVERPNKLYNYKPNQYQENKNSIPSLSGFARDLASLDDSPIPHEQPSCMTQSSRSIFRSDSKRTEISVDSVRTKEKEANYVLIRKQEEELEKCKLKLNKLQEDNYAHVGEVKLLRDTISRKEQELIQEKQQHMKDFEKWKEERNQTTLELNKEINSLKTELQFKSQELLEMQSKYQLLEIREREFTIRKSDTKTKAVDNFTLKQTLQKNHANSISPKKMRTFPRYDDVNWTKVQLSTSEAIVQTDDSATPVETNTLPLKHPRGKLSGPKIISHLLSTDMHKNYLLDGGLISVFHRNQLLPDQQKFVSEEMFRISGTNHWNSLCDGEQMMSKDTSANQLLVLNGINRLLSNESVDPSRIESSLTSFFPFIEERINDYMCFLTEQYNSSSKNNTMPSRQLKQPDSCFTSLSSAHISSSSKVRSCHSNGLAAERTLLSSLKLLTKLLSLSPVSTENSLCSSTMDLFVRPETHFQQSSTFPSKPSQNSSPLQSLITLVQLLIHLDLKANSEVPEACLGALHALIMTAGKSFLPCLQNFLSPSFFGTLLQYRINANVILFSLQIATSLISLPEISLLLPQTHQEMSCPLSLLGKLCQEIFTSFTNLKATSILQQVIDFLSVIVCHHGIKMLIHDADESSCFTELIVGLIVALNAATRSYKCNHSTKGLNVLRSGVTLLHQFSSLDSHFVAHRLPVQREYVLLINEISKLWKHSRNQLNSWEVIAMQELNEFSQDDSEEFVSKQENSPVHAEHE